MFKFNLPKVEWVSLLKGAGIAAVGAVLTYVTQAVGQIDFGPNAPLVAAGMAVVANYVRKVLTAEQPAAQA